MVNKRMKFKPVRQSNAVFVLIIDIFLGGLATMILFLSDYPKIIIPCVWAAFALPLVYCLSYSKKLKTFKQNGICIPGCIIGVYEQISSSAPNVYYLKIVFLRMEIKNYVHKAIIRILTVHWLIPNVMCINGRGNIWKLILIHCVKGIIQKLR